MLGLPFLVLLFMLATSVAAAVTAVGWRRRRTAPAVGALALLSAAIVVWSAADALAFLVQDAVVGHLLRVTKFIGVCAIPAGFFCLSLAVVDRMWRLSRRTALLLAVEPVLVLVASVTDPWHHLFFLPPDPADPMTLTRPDFGPLFWVHTAYSYLLLSVGVTRLIRAWVRGPRAQRKLYGAILLGAILPAVANIIALWWGDYATDLTPVGFCVTAVVTYWALVHHSLPELIPVARGHVFDMIGDTVATIDASGRVLDLNSAGERLLRRMAYGLPDRIVGLSFEKEFGGLPSADGGETDLALADRDGRRIELNVRSSPLLDSRGGRVGWVMVMRDVTALNRQRRELEQANARLHEQRHELEQANARLHEQLRTIETLRADLAEQAVRDALTGLHNRRHLMEALRREAARAVADRSPLSLALLDVDHFKQVNDGYGHGAGDEVLVRLSGLLTGQARPQDVVARYGGEEFVVVLPGVPGDRARDMVEALRARVAGEPVHVGGHTLHVTFSAGVACLSGGQDPEDLLHAADEALYAAKRGGRDRVELAAAPDGRETAASGHRDSGSSSAAA
ncbi:diguanylate cyclase [Planomonospora sp. ID67723]|uniref:histidine kinase N-terminal 7TM domain-containing diguanylate cyclase n=1 Tax=Planomonospora sp. ID67723 TaxID=2738134 RepID=UPI0018C43903|nr:diguanylate cyclase [Planomonospora sp. ID67723]MBG0826368.1 diguanylate cyclase [Planomonospora sp. ID67723]